MKYRNSKPATTKDANIKFKHLHLLTGARQSVCPDYNSAPHTPPNGQWGKITTALAMNGILLKIALLEQRHKNTQKK